MMTTDYLDLVRRGDAAALTLLDGRPELAQARDDNGVPAALLALYYGHRDLAAQLARRSELDLYAAAAFGALGRLRALLDASPELINSHASDGFHPLGLACFFGQPEAAALLIERGADVNLQAANGQRVAAIHAASAARSVEICRMLLDAGADVNLRQHGGFTALHAAAQHGDEALAQLLLERGADPSARTDDGRSAADFAAPHPALLHLFGGEDAEKPRSRGSGAGLG